MAKTTITNASDSTVYSTDFSSLSTKLTWTTAATIGDPSTTISVSDPYSYQPSLDVKGDANIDGDLMIGGKSLNRRLDNIEKMLKIPPQLRDQKELEEKYEELKKLREEYEAKVEKYITWDNMKKDV